MPATVLSTFKCINLLNPHNHPLYIWSNWGSKDISKWWSWMSNWDHLAAAVRSPAPSERPQGAQFSVWHTVNRSVISCYYEDSCLDLGRTISCTALFPLYFHKMVKTPLWLAIYIKMTIKWRDVSRHVKALIITARSQLYSCLYENILKLLWTFKVRNVVRVIELNLNLWRLTTFYLPVHQPHTVTSAFAISNRIK